MERRNTRQRQVILDAVLSRCDHPSAEQIYDQVKASDPSISIGTVYRNLSVLSEEGKILSIKLPGADRFDLTTERHNHFVCEKCGKVFDISISYNKKLDNITSSEGFVVRSHQTVFSGLCKDCAALEEAGKAEAERR